MNLVTGATGLLGSHIVEQLRRRGQPVRVLVRPTSDRSWLETQGVEFVEGDITDPASLKRACEGCDNHWPINPTTLLHDNGMGQTTICMNGRTK